MTYREACVLNEYCVATLILCEYFGYSDSTTVIVSEMRNNDSITVKLSATKWPESGTTDRRSGKFQEFKSALAFAQSLFIWRTICETG